jgi:hypothetical protein
VVPDAEHPAHLPAPLLLHMHIQMRLISVCHAAAVFFASNLVVTQHKKGEEEKSCRVVLFLFLCLFVLSVTYQ